jgi:hypothetical protein
MVITLRITSILLVVMVELAVSNVPAPAQNSRFLGDKWAKICVKEIRERIKQRGAPIGTVSGAADVCCVREKDSDCRTNSANCRDDALQICKSTVKADADIAADMAKAEKEVAEKEQAKAAGNCKGVKVKGDFAEVCCTASKGTGCVAQTEDCLRLGGTEVTAGAVSACNKVFPGYTGHTAIRSGETNCSQLNTDNTTWTAKEFTKFGNGQCRRTYACVLKSPLQEPFSALCRLERLDPASSQSPGTCTDPKCSDCKSPPPSAKCRASFVQR